MTVPGVVEAVGSTFAGGLIRVVGVRSVVVAVDRAPNRESVGVRKALQNLHHSCWTSTPTSRLVDEVWQVGRWARE